MIVAVDGPAGAGKSTVCKLLAEKLGFVYLDSGAMYRALAWVLAQQDVKAEDSTEFSHCLAGLPFRFHIEADALTIFYQDRRLGEELRQPEIAGAASRISQIAAVRNYLTAWQRQIAGMGNVVAEGRDVTTVVFPQARVKVFLTADIATRARRRFLEYQQKNIPADYATIEEQIRDRDQADQQRSLAPLRAAPDAVIVDSSAMTIAEVVGHLAAIVQSGGVTNGYFFAQTSDSNCNLI